MKKSFFIGFLATLGLSENYAGTSYTSTTHTSGSTITVGTTQYPSVTAGQAISSITSGTSQQSLQNNINQIISSARGSTVSQQRSIDSLFLSLPSFTDIDRLILNADTVALLKTVQVVATNDALTCDQKLSYLLELLGRIKIAVESKQFSADQLKTIISGAQSEVSRIQAEINRLNGSITDLWIPEIQDQLNAALADLENSYAKFNALEREIAPKDAQVAGFKSEIAIIERANDDERTRIATDKLKLTEAQALIRDLETRLAAARQQRVSIEAEIARSQQLIGKNDAAIADARNKIKALEQEVKRLQDQADQLRSQYTKLEVEVERLRTEISIAETKADGQRKQIADLQARIDAQRQNLVQPELDAILDMIASLKRAIPTVQQEIDRHYYYCYGAGVQEQQVQSVVVYVVKGERFGDYLQEQYGTNIRAPNVNGGQVSLQRVNILGKTWVDKFGYPFAQSSLGGNGDNFNIAGSFNCLTPSKAVKGSGTIYDVGADYIGVQTQDGQRAKFALGTCSRIESTSSLPTIGQNIAYVAVPSSAQGYNLYQASCY